MILAAENAGRQTVTEKRQKEAPKKTAPKKKASKKKASKKAEVAKEEIDRLQRRTQAPVALGQSYTRVPFCTHQFRWTDVPGRSRCEYHSYSPKAYRNPFRSRCPGCRTIACGLCRKKLKRGDTLPKVYRA
ncbi:hypothetical protein GQ44DRAFT_706894 [Phaeosphaeriaceae sp. PMI808]|nr:hypothetical protein GQ44DRAFT_706894 [Phaeosphaeriaceae sp. PMI808]